MDNFDRSKLAPPDDAAMLPWYRGAFSHGFVALHPFFTVDGLDPATCDYGTLVMSGSDRPDDVNLLEWMDVLGAERRAGKEIPHGSLADITKRFASRIRWQTICQQLNLPDHRALDRALRTNILGLRRDLEDRAAVERLVTYCRQERIFLPTEGYFQPTMEADLVSLFQRAGLSEVIVGDEFGEDEIVVSLTTLADCSSWETRDDLPKWGARRLIAPDRSLLAWVHWDSFYTAVFGTQERMRDIQIGESFEGFWCSEETTTFWLMEDAVPIVQ
ncbi:DUF2711 family protein [Altericroceibacterium endophyticum]|uniref:DUF2711 family protein n=1 Tax=Altericroceibacterium endophyticum TaxID=1808508 RepID=A0A6I4T672_9SPHN|nr:DUF2711 family protein [Altericroceibacterium endophyticum]MXO66337.1 DUF2711 family protein [Altericroceibacterium endophyticum]